jgi:hypothetical protein
MARVTQKLLVALVATVSKMGRWPQGPYPTAGQLILNNTGTGRWQLTMLTTGTGEADISRCLTASEMEEFLRGMIAAYDAPRLRAHWDVPAAPAEAPVGYPAPTSTP